MKIPIPRQYDQVLDWLAAHLLPPDRPTGLRVLGYTVTWLDVALAAYPAAGATGMWLWTGDWWWFPAAALCMVFAALTLGWK